MTTDTDTVRCSYDMKLQWTAKPALLMRMSSRGSDFRKFSAKLRTDFRLPRSSCMNTTWLFPLSCRKHEKLIEHITILQCPSTVMNEPGITCTIMYILDDIAGYLGQTWVFCLVKNLLTLLISSSAASPRCLLRQARITRAPLLARSRAVVFPIPVLLPVGEKAFILLIRETWCNTVATKHSLYLPVTITVFPCSFALLVHLFPFTTISR